MSFSPVQLVLFILVFVPGYIFISICDYHLAKGEKSQFEKTVRVLLVSTVIWVLALVCPYLPFISTKKDIILSYILNIFSHRQIPQSGEDIKNIVMVSLYVYIAVCVYSFILANIWGVLRRLNPIEYCFQRITGRDRYRTVALRFYTEQLGSTVAITTKDGERYLGILSGAPDDTNDNSIIISKPSIIENGKFVKLFTSQMLLATDSITRLEVIKPYKRR
jgi:hypothetical protein